VGDPDDFLTTNMCSFDATVLEVISSLLGREAVEQEDVVG
jgi:hypothetical protein